MTDYILGAHAVGLAQTLDSGGMLNVTAGGIYWYVVDVSLEGSTMTWTIDRKLIGDPDVLSWGVIAGVERETATEEGYDSCPDEGEPRGVYALSKTWS